MKDKKSQAWEFSTFVKFKKKVSYNEKLYTFVHTLQYDKDFFQNYV